MGLKKNGVYVNFSGIISLLNFIKYIIWFKSYWGEGAHGQHGDLTHVVVTTPLTRSDILLLSETLICTTVSLCKHVFAFIICVYILIEIIYITFR
jgi:hypothetical protein